MERRVLLFSSCWKNVRVHVDNAQKKWYTSNSLLMHVEKHLNYKLYPAAHPHYIRKGVLNIPRIWTRSTQSGSQPFASKG